MDRSKVDRLVALHTAFWDRELDEALVNLDCSITRRFRHVAPLPAQWEGRDGLRLTPEMLEPEQYQTTPIAVSADDPVCGEVAFNTLFPYHRVPWLIGIVGCDMEVSTSSQTVWPISPVADDWYDQPRQGFEPNLKWLEKLLEFLQYIIDRFTPDQCIAAPDMIARGPGDLILAVLGPERFYTGVYDHPDAVKSLHEQIVDVYIQWGLTQIDLIPKFCGGYCNQYGIWSPGSVIRFQEDYAINISRDTFEEFLLPGLRRVTEAFEYGVIHTHSGAPQLAEWMLAVDELKAIEVTLDPHGPAIEQLLPLLNQILDHKCLIVAGVVTQSQLDTLLSRLQPSGLLLDVAVVTEAELTAAHEWSYDAEDK